MGYTYAIHKKEKAEQGVYSREELTTLHIEIDVTELLSDDLAALEESEERLENLRAWGKKCVADVCRCRN